MTVDAITQATQVYKWLMDCILDDGVLRLPADASFPVEFFVEIDNARNVVLVRECSLHLLEMYCWVQNRRKFDGLIQRGIIVTGPPGDGKVQYRPSYYFFASEFCSINKRVCVLFYCCTSYTSHLSLAYLSNTS